ncbi:Dda-like helicase [Vibrio phage D472]
MPLTSDQKSGLAAFEKFLFDDVERDFVLSGFSGCGKTHLTEEMLNSLHNAIKTYQLLDANRHIEYMVTATTNAAANVLSKRLKLPVGTIFSALDITLRECHRTGRELLNFSKCKVIRDEIIYFVDEASYLSKEMLLKMREYRPNAKFVYIGDKFQLAPIGFDEAPAFGIKCPSFHLNKIVRNTGPLQDFVVALKDGVEKSRFFSLHDWHNGSSINIVNGEDFQAAIDAEFGRTNFKINDAKILAYHNKTVRAYAEYVRELQGKPEDFVQGDCVIVNKTYGNLPTDSLATVKDIRRAREDKYSLATYQLTLQEIGSPVPFTTETGKLNALLKSYAASASAGDIYWSEYFDLKNYFIDIRDPNSCTTHKSQGSTFEKVFIDMHDLNECRSKSMLRRLRYVGGSRASKEVWIYV